MAEYFKMRLKHQAQLDALRDRFYVYRDLVGLDGEERRSFDPTELFVFFEGLGDEVKAIIDSITGRSYDEEPEEE